MESAKRSRKRTKQVGSADTVRTYSRELQEGRELCCVPDALGEPSYERNMSRSCEGRGAARGAYL